jgi:hypothetical protein
MVSPCVVSPRVEFGGDVSRASNWQTFRVAEVHFLLTENHFPSEFRNRDKSNKSCKKADDFTHTHTRGATASRFRSRLSRMGGPLL